MRKEEVGDEEGRAHPTGGKRIEGWGERMAAEGNL